MIAKPFFTESLAQHAARLGERQCETQARREALLNCLTGRGHGRAEKAAQLMAWLDVKNAGLILRPWS